MRFWGFLPCAKVYAALFYAMLSGSWLGGTLVMSGFGLGTLPALAAAGLGLPLFRRWATSVRLRHAVGLAIIMVGIAGIMVGIAGAGISPTTIVAWCRAG